METLVNSTSYDNGSGTLQPSYCSDIMQNIRLYTVGQGSGHEVKEKLYLLFISQAQYSALAHAQVASLPIPSSDIINSVTLIADIISSTRSI